MEEDITVVTTDEAEENKKSKKKKKNIPKKEKITSRLWIVFLIIFILICVLRFGIPAVLASDNPKTLKAIVTVGEKLMDDTIEYKNKNGETHKYYLTVDYSYFDKGSKLKTPFIIEREEKDGTKTVLPDKAIETLDDGLFGDEKTAVVLYFINSGTKKVGFDLIDEYYSGKDPDKQFDIGKAQRIGTDIFVFYLLFFIIYSIYAYYQIWSRKYDEKLELEKQVQEMNLERQKGISKEAASVKQAPKKLTKKQRRELNKQNRE